MNRIHDRIVTLHNSALENDTSLEHSPVIEARRDPSHEDKSFPSIFCRHGYRIMSVFRSLGNSVPSPSLAESTMTSPRNLPGRSRLFSLTPLNNQAEPTVVHRTKFKSRPSVISFEKKITEFTLEPSPPSSAESSTDRRNPLVIPIRTIDPSGETLKSKPLTIPKLLSHLSTQEKTRRSKTVVGEADSKEYPLGTILEGGSLDLQLLDPIPTFITVEKAASAKIYFECHYNDLATSRLTPRSLRRRQFERFLYQNQDLTALEREARRKSLARDECEHLRRTRIIKSKVRSAMMEKNGIQSRYEGIKVLGKGSFGVVRLVREKIEDSQSESVHLRQEDEEERQEIYAMKVIRKSKMLQNSQEGHLRAERDFLVSAEKSRWVVPLISSFQDDVNLYLVMEYMPGGDFLGLLIRENVLSEPVTRWYIAEMIICIEEAHNLRWIHRDIKPDNFLISSSGHLKISDFGLAFDGHWSHDQSYFNNHRNSLLSDLELYVEGDSLDRKESKSIASAMKVAHSMISDKEHHEIDALSSINYGGILNWRNKHSNRNFARSVVGTSQYMAPEVVRGELYDARCDWWSLAVIIYECLYGYTPFLSEEGGRQQTKLNILNHKTVFNFPQRPVVSRRCQDLIRSIIQEKDIRLCSKRYRAQDNLGNHQQSKDYAGHYVFPKDAEEIKAHKWFRGIEWDSLHLMIPPIVPDINSREDTRYFDEDSVSDFSESVDEIQQTPEDVSTALKPFSQEIHMLIKAYFERPCDSARLRKVENKIDNFLIPEEHKKYLKTVVRLYGQKRKKRPRDRLLRDKLTGAKVLELRKKGAFLGYTYRRFRYSKNIWRTSIKQGVNLFASKNEAAVFQRPKLAIN